MKKNKTMIFLFILPTVLCLLFMYVYPVVRTVIMSFFKVEPYGNYKHMGASMGCKLFQNPAQCRFYQFHEKHGDDLAGRRHHYDVPVHVDGRT